MTGMPKGALLVWMDVEAGHQDDFDAWYNRQHLFERIAVPGFLTGRRWEAVAGAPRFLATYETVSPEALQGEEYRHRLENPTPWTLRVMPRFRNTIRGVCAITARRGSGAGGCIATLRLSPAASWREPLRQWLSGQGLAQIAQLPGIVSAYLCEAVQREESRTRTAEQELRKEPDRSVDWVILIEGTSDGAVGNAAGRLQTGAKESAGVAGWSAELGVYRFLCGVVPTDAEQS